MVSNAIARVAYSRAGFLALVLVAIVVALGTYLVAGRGAPPTRAPSSVESQLRPAPNAVDYAKVGGHATVAIVTPVAPAVEGGSSKATRQTSASCTMAVPPVGASVEVEIPNASDFCELVSHALAGDVFHAPVLVTPGALWHYSGAALSCRLRYADTRHRITIRNSLAACRWLSRPATGWRVESGARRTRRWVVARHGQGVRSRLP
jgi:hypothetical protein